MGSFAKIKRGKDRKVNAAEAARRTEQALHQQVLDLFAKASKTRTGAEKREIAKAGFDLLLPWIRQDAEQPAVWASNIMRLQAIRPVMGECEAIEAKLIEIYGGATKKELGEVIVGKGDKARSLFQRLCQLRAAFRAAEDARNATKEHFREEKRNGGGNKSQQGKARRTHQGQQRFATRPATGPAVAEALTVAAAAA